MAWPPSGIAFRLYRPGDEEAIIRLMRPYWHHLRSRKAREFWRWEYFSCAQDEPIIMVAEHLGRIVGHYAVIPLRMNVGQEVLMGARAEGAVVHPGYRGNIAPRFFPQREDVRIVKTLIRRIFAIAKHRRVEVIWGFPTDVALKAEVRAGYTHVPLEVVFLVMVLDARRAPRCMALRHPLSVGLASLLALGSRLYGILSMPRGRAGLPAEEGVELRVLSCLTREDEEELGELWDRVVSEADLITITRSPEFLRARLLGNPVMPNWLITCRERGELVGYVVVSLGSVGGVRYGILEDMVALKEHRAAFLRLVKAAVRFLRAMGAAHVFTWLGVSRYASWYVKALRRAGFLGRAVRKNFIVKLTTSRLDEKYIMNSRNWFITRAFSEGVR